MGGNQLTFDNFGALMPYPMLLYQCLWMTIINGNSRILKWRYVSTIFQAIVWGYIPLHSPYIGLICSRYRHFRILEFPLTLPITLPWYDGCDPNNLTITNGAFREKQILELASGKLTVCYWKWSIYSGFTHNKMVILQGYYVSLPEGKWSFFRAAPGPVAGTSTFRCWSASTVIRLSSSSTNLPKANGSAMRFLTFRIQTWDINGYQKISGDIAKLKNWTPYLFLDPQCLNHLGLSLKISMLSSWILKCDDFDAQWQHPTIYPFTVYSPKVLIFLPKLPFTW